MNKENILDLLMMLSALESWSFANKNDLPGYLQETLDENIKRLRLALLNDDRDELLEYIDMLRSAILETLDENGHLADGDNCTLIKLKRAVNAE